MYKRTDEAGRDLAPSRSRSLVWLDPIDDLMGFLCCQLVSSVDVRIVRQELIARVGYGCQYLNNTAQFRVPLAIQIVPAVVLFV